MSRVLLLDADKVVDVFEVVALEGSLARVRSPYLFEIGAELRLRVEHDGKTRDTKARVRSHVGAADETITELELGESA